MTSSPARTPWQMAGLILGPVLALVLAFFFQPVQEQPQIGYMIAVAVLMAVWWISEAIPLAATSLLPFVLFPVLGVMETGEVAGSYFNSIIFLFLGGFLIALAMERWNLHRRIALAIISAVGSNPSSMVLDSCWLRAFSPCGSRIPRQPSSSADNLRGVRCGRSCSIGFKLLLSTFAGKAAPAATTPPITHAGSASYPARPK